MSLIGQGLASLEKKVRRMVKISRWMAVGPTWRRRKVVLGSPPAKPPPRLSAARKFSKVNCTTIACLICSSICLRGEIRGEDDP
jgi:hypothetical protein